MANAGPNTDGGQLFITFAVTPFLDGKNTIFGELIRGDATLDAIEPLGTSRGTPLRTVVIGRATIAVPEPTRHSAGIATLGVLALLVHRRSRCC